MLTNLNNVDDLDIFTQKNKSKNQKNKLTIESSLDQPIIGVIDTGFSANHLDLDYSRIQLGRDYIDSDDNPLTFDENNYEHGTQILNIIGATQGNGIDIDGFNDDAPLWVSRAVGSGKWAESLVEFVNAAKTSGQANAVVNLSFDLVQVNSDGSITTRYELTSAEQTALEYARQHDVLVVSAAGNQGGAMSALGQAAQEFDNLIVVGAADGLDRADSSSYGDGLTLLAEDDGGGTSTATAQVTGAVSQVWAANPELNYHQVIDVLEVTATDFNTPGWDEETGFGILNFDSALKMAVQTDPVREKILEEITPPMLRSFTVDEVGLERPAGWFDWIPNPLDWIPKIPNPLDWIPNPLDWIPKIPNPLDWYDTLTDFGKDFVNNTLTDVGKDLVKGVRWLTTEGVEWAFDQFGNGIELAFDALGLEPVGEFLSEEVIDKISEKLQGILLRQIQWVEELPSRIEQFNSDFLSDSWNNGDFWKSLGKWFVKDIVNAVEIDGIPEILETIADLIKFNTRPLNHEELEIAKSVFGDSIDYDVVRIDTSSLASSIFTPQGAFVTFNTINTSGSLDDAILIHELTHVWQYQQDGAIYIPEALGAQWFGEGYDYGDVSTLENQNFYSLNREQQAAVIEDFYRLKTEGWARYDSRATQADLPIYTRLVDEVSTLSQAQLLAPLPFIIGGDGDDELIGDTASNYMFGGDGDDEIDGGVGDDTVWGENGNDVIYGGTGDDEIYGGIGDDEIDGGIGDDVIYGGIGDDVIYGGIGDDVIYGENGDDIIVGSQQGVNEIDYLTGGNGADQFLLGDDDGNMYSVAGDSDYAVITDFQTGQDTIQLDADASLNYSLSPSPVSGISGTAIYANSELVGILQGVSESDLVFENNTSTVTLKAGGDNYEEPNNNSPETAYDITGYERTWLEDIDGFESDNYEEDWYKLKTTSGSENLIIESSLTHTQGNLDMVLLNSSMEYIASSFSHENNGNGSIDVAAPADTYYLGIFVYDVSSSNTYDLWWDATAY